MKGNKYDINEIFIEILFKYLVKNTTFHLKKHRSRINNSKMEHHIGSGKSSKYVQLKLEYFENVD